MPEGRFAATCVGCDKEYRRHKREKVGTWRYCRTCGPVLGRLVYQDTRAVAAATPSTLQQSTHDTPPTPKKLRG